MFGAHISELFRRYVPWISVWLFTCFRFVSFSLFHSLSLYSLSLLLFDLPTPWCFRTHVCFYFVFIVVDTRGIYLQAIIHQMPHLFCFVSFGSIPPNKMNSKNIGSAKSRKSICIFFAWPQRPYNWNRELFSYFFFCDYHANGMRAVAKPCA